MHYIPMISSYSAKKERALTLVEIMVVLVILTILTAFIANKLFGAGDKAKRQLNMMRMQDLKQAINLYQLQMNALPPNLDALVHGSNGSPTTANEGQLKDAWGNQFTYTLNDSGRSYVIKTLGADGREGGEDVNFDDTLSGP